MTKSTITARPRDWVDAPEDELEDSAVLDTDKSRGTPGPWEPVTYVTMSVPGRLNNAPPAYDDDLDGNPDAAPSVYPAWGPGETFVVSGPYGVLDPDLPTPRGTLHASRGSARRWAMGKYGAIFEEYGIPGKWAFRVPVPGGPHDPRRGK